MLGWVGNGFFVAGILTIAEKQRAGFGFCAIGNACYMVKSIGTGDIDLVSLSLFLISLNIYSFLKWGRP